MAAPTGPPIDRSGTPTRTLLVLVAMLAGINVLTNRVLPEGAYVPFALAAAGGLIAYAVLGDGRTRTDLGGDPGAVPTGLRWGAVLAVIVALVYAVGMALPATRPLFEDARVEGLDGAAVAYHALVRVPLGTVALEEVAFRGVLLSMLLARTSTLRAVAWSSLLFGLWHVLPIIGMGPVNPTQEDHLEGTDGTLVAVVGGVAATALAGAFLCWLRLRTHSLVAPMVLHWATNGLGYLAAWIVLTRL